jgi:hypothetical protein
MNQSKAVPSFLQINLVSELFIDEVYLFKLSFSCHMKLSKNFNRYPVSNFYD